MACILRPECNFLHRYFRCQLPVEMVDVEVKVKKMQALTCSEGTGHPKSLSVTPGAQGSILTPLSSER